MNLYLLFLTVATLTVLSPGPGVLMTLTNALRYGLRGTIGGILGIAFGALLVAGISATTLGAVLAASALAFTVLKLAGAAYLIYLGARLWRSPPVPVASEQAHQASFKRRFLEGLSLQLTNPKAIFFFLSVFPQFIEGEAGFVRQFALLVLTYAALVVVIHTGYARFAHQARAWLTSEHGGRTVNRLGGATFMCFGVALTFARKGGA